jgi:biopolymer transport protein ExbB
MPQPVSTSWLQDLNSADPIVMGTLYLLLSLSAVTWFIIAYKALELWRAKRANAAYLKRFWEQKDVASLKNGSKPEEAVGPLAQLTASGLEVLRRHEAFHVRAEGVAGNLTDSLTRGLRQTIQDQLTRFEAGLGVLATIGNTAPFIGLFGTVIGIMSALKGISRTGAAGLDVVAGPIGEALIATAAGIACAVPAVVGYNTFVRRMKVLGNTLETFAYDLLARITAEHAAGHSHPEVREKELRH